MITDKEKLSWALFHYGQKVVVRTMTTEFEGVVDELYLRGSYGRFNVGIGGCKGLSIKVEDIVDIAEHKPNMILVYEYEDSIG